VKGDPIVVERVLAGRLKFSAANTVDRSAIVVQLLGEGLDAEGIRNRVGSSADVVEKLLRELPSARPVAAHPARFPRGRGCVTRRVLEEQTRAAAA
jgi:hypothetical protein